MIAKKVLGVESDSSKELFVKMDLFENKKISYSQFISSSIPYTKFFNKKRLIVFFNLSDINRDKKLCVSDLKNFLKIQFQHRD